MANKFRGRVDASEFFGEGRFFQFNWQDLADIENHFGEDWWVSAMESLDKNSPNNIILLVKHGLKDADGSRVVPEFSSEFSPRELTVSLEDALCYAAEGMSAKDLAEKLKAMQKEAIEKAIPPNLGQEASSDPLDALPSGPALDQTNSGD